jgi:hypothetical protein
MSNSFTTTIYNELTSDLKLPSYKNNKDITSIFLKQGGGSKPGSNDNSDINNLLSMLTTETDLNTTETDKIENRLKNMMQSGGGDLGEISATSDYSSLFLSKNEILSATSNSSNIELSATSVQIGGDHGLLSETSVQMGNELLSETSILMNGGGSGNPLSTTSVSVTSVSLTSAM